jgi:hypothetical protein
MIARIISMTTGVSLYTPPFYKCLLLMQARYIIRWETVDSIVGVCKSWISYILQNSTSHTSHFTLESIFLQSLLPMQKQEICDGIHYLTKDMILKVWVKMVDFIVYHTISAIPKWDSAAFFTDDDTFATHHCLHFSENYDT